MLQRPIECSQYASTAYATYCVDIGVRVSMGRTGVCWDNAVAESFFATLKNEISCVRQSGVRIPVSVSR